jgi:hypothetical protein
MALCQFQVPFIQVTPTQSTLLHSHRMASTLCQDLLTTQSGCGMQTLATLVQDPFERSHTWYQFTVAVSGSSEKTQKTLETLVQDLSHKYAYFNGFQSDSQLENGWILNFPSQLLFWVPPWSRKGLWWPRNTAVIAEGSTKLDLQPVCAWNILGTVPRGMSFIYYIQCAILCSVSPCFIRSLNLRMVRLGEYKLTSEARS